MARGSVRGLHRSRRSRTLSRSSRSTESHPSNEAVVASRVHPRRDKAVLWGCARNASCVSSAWITEAEVPTWGLDRRYPRP
jgi:hypothetical protein